MNWRDPENIFLRWHEGLGRGWRGCGRPFPVCANRAINLRDILARMQTLDRCSFISVAGTVYNQVMSYLAIASLITPVRRSIPLLDLVQFEVNASNHEVLVVGWDHARFFLLRIAARCSDMMVMVTSPVRRGGRHEFQHLRRGNEVIGVPRGEEFDSTRGRWWWVWCGMLSVSSRFVPKGFCYGIKPSWRLAPCFLSGLICVS